jgi:tetratricopeptide (TPR) repeat protein
VATWLEALSREPSSERVRELLWAQAGIDFEDGTRGGGNPAALARSLEVQRALTRAAPDNSLFWANLGNSLRVAGDLQGSIDAYAKAAEENPFDASVPSDQGLAYLGAEREDEALAAWDRAIAIDAGFVSAHQNAARVRWLRGDVDAAEAHVLAAFRSARPQGTGEGLFRFLWDRTWRTRRSPEVR